MELSFDEIQDGEAFEELVAAFFRLMHAGISIDVKKSGVGADGGRDILVCTTYNDKISEYKRTWVVQCKFHNNNISPETLKSVNIPSLIHSHKACGYLLVCKQSPTSGLTNLFDNLNSNCIHNYQYVCWSGSAFKTMLIGLKKVEIYQSFFPKYYEYINKLAS